MVERVIQTNVIHALVQFIDAQEQDGVQGHTRDNRSQESVQGHFEQTEQRFQERDH